MNQKQIDALTYLLLISKDVETDLMKKLLVFLIKKSELLTKSVCLTLWEATSGFSREEIDGMQREISCLTSCNRTTHANEILTAMGSDFRLSSHYGDFDPERPLDPFDNSGQFYGIPSQNVETPEKHKNAQPFRATFWLAKGNYSNDSERVEIDRAALEQVEAVSDLYDHHSP